MIGPNPALCFDCVKDVENVLRRFGISTEGWQKDTGALLKEIEEADCYLEVVSDKLIRKVDVARVRCFYENEIGEKFQLKEDKQVFLDGKEKVRKWECVSEKKHAEEDPEHAALRALEEELQIPVGCVQVIADEDMLTTETKVSSTYKGLTSIYNFYNFSANIPKDQYQPEYKEVQPDKTTYFSWKKLDQSDLQSK
jgi:hypothetical protein